MAHLKPQLHAVKAAVGGIGNAYYNMPLSDIAHVAPASAFNLGDAAQDMLRPVHHNRFNAGKFFAATDTKTNQFRYVGADLSAGKLGDWRLQHDFCDNCESSAWKEWNAWNTTDAAAAAPLFAKQGDAAVLQMQGEGLRPFAAVGGGNLPWQQFGVRWQKSSSRFGVLAEASRVSEEESFMGADFGALGRGSGESKQGRFLLHGDITKNWRGFAEYRQARGDAEIADGGFLSSAEDLRAESWAAGLEWSDILSFGDRFRLTARRGASFTGGRGKLHWTESDGDFTRAFYADALGEDKPGARQQLHERERTLDFGGGKTALVFSLGYAARMQNGGEIAFGAEYAGGESALSAQYRLEF